MSQIVYKTEARNIDAGDIFLSGKHIFYNFTANN